MRCDEVMRERSAPGVHLDRSALAEHLASCPRCASWSAQADQLDSIWDDTRPAELSGPAFDAIWAKATVAASEPEILPFVPTPAWKRWGVGLLALAQAAGILIACLYALSRPTPAVAAVHDYQIEEGTTLVVRLDGGPGEITSVEVRPQRGRSDTDMVAVDLDVLNYMESEQFE